MKAYQFRIFLFALLGVMITSCGEDAIDELTNDDITIENFQNGNDGQRNGGNGNNGGPGGNNGGNDGGPGGNNGGGNNGGPGGNNDGGPGGNNGQEDEVQFLSNDVTEQWTDLFLAIERYAEGLRPNGSARALAYINLAAYETAIPGMDGYRSNDGRIPGFNLNMRLNTSNIDYELALNTCYADVLDHFLINVSGDQKSMIPVLETELEETYSEGLSDNQIENSQEWGAAVAARVIQYSLSDSEAEDQLLEPQPRSYEPPTGDGFWTYSADPERALFPYWGSVRTFVVTAEETSTVDPIPYSEDPNSAYFAQMMDVYQDNNAAKADQGEELWIAEFWSDDVENIMFSPPARQYAIANQLIDQYDLNLAETLHLYVKLGFSLNDAAVSTWEDKYEHMVMRPNVFIHEFIDPDFQTNLFRLVYWPNPSFPGYPSGHSCFASAASGVFIDFFGDETNFTDRSHEGRTEFLSNPRTFSTFSEMAAENAYSRIPLGVHIEMDCTEGLRLGYEISDGINEYSLKRRSS